MSRKTDWINECITNYIKSGVAQRDAIKYAHQNALQEEIEHGGVVDIWEPADALVAKQMELWSQSV
jgi:hypothetical protein